MDMATGEKIVCPSIVFKVGGCFYSVNSERCTGIMQIPEYQEVPEAPGHVMGIFILRGATVTMVDMRVIFGQTTMRQELEQFEMMMESFKNEHLEWAGELERCVSEGDFFSLSTDPHYCGFGNWYYGECGEKAKAQLGGIEEPHDLLHAAAQEVMQLALDGDSAGAEALLNRVKKGYVPAMLGIIDRAVEDNRFSLQHEMVLVFPGSDGKQYGVVVDEVVSVEELQKVPDHGTMSRYQHGGLIVGVCKSGRMDDIVLELNEDKLLELCQ